MNGNNKAFLRIGGKRFIDLILDVFRGIFDDIIIVTNDPEAYYDLDVRIVSDIIPSNGPLSGIHAGLYHAEHPWIFTVPCDLPFIRKELIETLIDQIRPQYSVVIPRTSAGYEALFALYSKKNIPAIEKNLNIGRKKIQSFFKPPLVREVPEKILRAADPELTSFFNVNSPIELEQAETIEASGARSPA
jgi:molybdopterin-guanine dinucleotide biosynthesis protein A